MGGNIFLGCLTTKTAAEQSENLKLSISSLVAQRPVSTGLRSGWPTHHRGQETEHRSQPASDEQNKNILVPNITSQFVSAKK